MSPGRCIGVLVLALAWAGHAPGGSVPASARAGATDALSRARAVTRYIQTHFWDARKGLYRGFHPPRKGKLPYAFMWDNVVQTTVLTAAMRHDRDVYAPVLARFFEGLDAHWDARRDPPGYQPYFAGGGDDRYYDDNAWAAIDLIYAWERTGEAKYLRRAEAALRFVLSGWDEKQGGGIHWHVSRGRDKSKAQKGVCSNATAAYAALRLARHKPPDRRRALIAHARRILNWTRRLQDTDKLYMDHVHSRTGKIQRHKWTYNTGMMIRCHLLAHRLTGDPADRAEAVAVGRAAEALLDARTGAYRDAPFFSHLMAEADVELYRATGQRQFLLRARRTGEHFWRTWRARPPEELKSVAGIARLLWVLADVTGDPPTTAPASPSAR